MGHAPGLEDQIPWSGYADLLTYLDADLTLQHVGVLVLVPVGVHRRGEGPRLDRVLDEREVTLGLLTPDHEPYAEFPQPHRLALIRRQHNARLRVHCFSHKRPPLPTSINTALTEYLEPYSYLLSASNDLIQCLAKWRRSANTT